MADTSKKTLNSVTLTSILVQIKSWILTILPDEIGSRIPSSLKNPNAITFTGGATGTYDGSKAVNINIPASSGVTVSGNTISFGKVKIGVD